MKFGWKDFFYFQQSEQRAIVLLLVLIVLCFSLTLSYHSFLKKEIIQEQETLTSEFEQFETGLTPQPETLFETETLTDDKSTIRKPKTSDGKLADGETIELNGANIAAIKRIPGIGDKFAQRILDYHNRLGGFVSIEQLTEIEGITANRLKKLALYIRLQRKPKQLRINRLSAQQLMKHPYISEAQAQSLVETRQRAIIKTPDDLRQVENFTPRDIDRLSGYVSFD
jgi:competence ComEA-like helix-hairpin-helix protein